MQLVPPPSGSAPRRRQVRFSGGACTLRPAPPPGLHHPEAPAPHALLSLPPLVGGPSLLLSLQHAKENKSCAWAQLVRRSAARPAAVASRAKEEGESYLDQLCYTEEVLGNRILQNVLRFRDRLDFIRVILFQHRGREAEAVYLALDLVKDCAIHPDVQHSQENSVYAFKLGAVGILMEGCRYGPAENGEELKTYLACVDRIDRDFCAVNPSGVFLYGTRRALEEAVSYFKDRVGDRKVVIYPDEEGYVPEEGETFVRASELFDHAFFNDDRLSDVRFERRAPARAAPDVFTRQLENVAAREPVKYWGDHVEGSL